MSTMEYMGLSGKNVKRFYEETNIDDSHVTVTGYRGASTYMELNSYGKLDAILELDAEQVLWFIDALTKAKETMESVDPIETAMEWAKANPNMCRCGLKDEFTFWYDEKMGWYYRTRTQQHGTVTQCAGNHDDNMYAILAKYY